MDFLSRLLEAGGAIVAGLFGAVAALRFQDELSTIQGRLMFVVTGAACAQFVTPLALSIYKIEAGLAGGVAFLLGAFGGSLLAAGFRALHSLDVLSIFKKRGGTD